MDDVEFGYEKSKQFMDAKRRRGKSDIRALIDLHNNEAGRLVRDVYSGFCRVCMLCFLKSNLLSVPLNVP